MTDRELSQNLLMAYMTLNAANQALKTIYAFKDRIDNKEFITLVKDTKPKISHFCNTIEKTLLASPQFRTKDWEELEENCWIILDNLDEEIKKL